MERELVQVIPDTTIIVSATEQDDRTRLDLFLAQRFPDYSRTFFQKLIDKGYVKVNDRVADKHSTQITTDDQVAIYFPQARQHQIKPKPFEGDLGVKVIFEHPDFIIIDKPAGLVVHPTSSEDQSISLVDWVLSRYPALEGVGLTDRPGIVHRLDKDTSGIMIIARSYQAQAQFSSMFKDRLITKEYYAVVQGHPDRSGTIDFPIARDGGVKNKMTHTQPDGRQSVTHFEVVDYFQDATLLLCKPVTGRTHQIRVHCAAIGYPIIGDVLYGQKSREIDRQALHAYRISFVYNKTPFSFTTQLPDDISFLLASFKKAPNLN